MHRFYPVDTVHFSNGGKANVTREWCFIGSLNKIYLFLYFIYFLSTLYNEI